MNTSEQSPIARIKHSFKTLPLRKKLIVIISAVSLLVVSLSMCASFVIELNLFRNQLFKEYTDNTRLVAQNLQASVMFEDPRDADEILNSFLQRQSITAAAVYLDNGYKLASYTISDDLTPPPLDSTTGLNGTTFTIKEPVMLEEQIIGHVTIRAEVDEIKNFILLRGLILASLLLLSTAIAIYLASRIGRMLSQPILDLAETAERISVEKDYSLRHEHTTFDETGKLVDAFNKMMIEIQNREVAILDSKEKAEASSKAKDDFLSVISHELRTPLNPIIGYVDVLYNKQFDTQEKRQLNLIKQYAQHLQGLIDDIIDYSRIERGVFAISSDPVDYKQICQDVVSLLEDEAKVKGLEIDYSHSIEERDKFQNVYVTTDKVRLRQILLNLIANSIKFTHEGQVHIRTHLYFDDTKTARLRFEVEDTGIGISPENRHKVFEPFSQIEATLTRQYSGMGLGLAITKKIVEAMNGRIDFKSVLGSGSTFWFEIPTKIGEKPNESKNQTRKFSATDGRILLVDDQLVNRELGESLISERGLNVVLAVDGFDAVDKVKSEDFSLIIMDIKMPRMDGYDTARKIRDLEADKKRTPIIAMTAHVTASGNQECFDAGMDDFLAKPFSSDKLDSILEKWLIDNKK